MLTTLRLFFSAREIHPWLVLLCLIGAGLAQSLGLATLLPLLTVLTGGELVSGSQLAQTVQSAMSNLGISFSAPGLVLLILGATLTKAALSFFALRHVGNAMAEVATRTRAHLIDQIFGARWSDLVATDSSAHVHALINLSAKRVSAYRVAAGFLSDLIRTTIYLLFAFAISWKLAIFAIVVSAVMAVALQFLVRIARRAGRHQTQRKKELVKHFIEGQDNIKALRSMGVEAAVRDLLIDKLEALKRALRLEVLSAEGLRAAQEVLVAAALAGGFLIAFRMSGVAIVDLVVVGVFLTNAIRRVAKLQSHMQSAVAIEFAVQEFKRVTDRLERSAEPQGGTKHVSLDRSCRLEDVSLSHAGKLILDRVNLEIPSRGLTVLIGPSGAGKTTIADLFTGLYHPDEGQVLIDDIPLKELDLALWRSQIGYVPQELMLFQDTLLENITLGRTDERAAREALERVGASSLVESLPEGLSTLAGHQGHRLSGGQRQRIALARAVVHRPRLLILDEATSALDSKAEIDLARCIADISRSCAVLAITHRDALLRHADRVYRIDHGHVKELQPVQPVHEES